MGHDWLWLISGPKCFEQKNCLRQTNKQTNFYLFTYFSYIWSNSIFSVHQEHMQCTFHGTQGTTAWELFSPIPSLFCKEFLLQRGQEACKHWDLPALSVTFVGSHRLSRNSCLQIPAHTCWQKARAHALNLMHPKSFRFAVPIDHCCAAHVLQRWGLSDAAKVVRILNKYPRVSNSDTVKIWGRKIGYVWAKPTPY